MVLNLVGSILVDGQFQPRVVLLQRIFSRIRVQIVLYTSRVVAVCRQRGRFVFEVRRRGLDSMFGEWLHRMPRRPSPWSTKPSLFYG